MSDDKKQGGGDPGEEQVRQAAGQGAPSVEEEGGEQQPRITLDRYMSSRRRQSWSYVHLLGLIFMLVTLVALLMYKDSCGRAVSGLIFLGGPDRGPPVKIKLDPQPAPPSPGKR